ncbi:MAG: hypothetical protein DMD60_03475 [Gemmatimonadetes bacterium]|nr:MAG: hypothetical protein DMD60_03475 [Gemmatimonadota bacterium]
MAVFATRRLLAASSSRSSWSPQRFSPRVSPASCRSARHRFSSRSVVSLSGCAAKVRAQSGWRSALTGVARCSWASGPALATRASASTSPSRRSLDSRASSPTLAAFGEEFVYRGYLLTRIARALGGEPRAWRAALVATSILFGVGHAFQGWSGVISAGLGGFLFGLLYLATGRNLWVCMIAHGTTDTVGFLLLYLGKYPGA